MAFERKLECYTVVSSPPIDHKSIKMTVPELRRFCKEQGLPLFNGSGDNSYMHFTVIIDCIIYAMDEEEEGAA